MVSIIVPVYNDPEGIQRTIESLRPQVTENQSRLIVVDNGSSDETPGIIDQYVDDPAVVRLFERDVQSSYAARNTGVGRSSDEVLAFVDADVTVGEDYLERGVERMDERGLDYLGCNVELAVPDGEDTLVARYNARAGFPVEQYVARHGYAPTAALFVRREVFENVGLFDPRLRSGGDMEFGNRVRNAGYELGYAADVTVTHPVRSSLAALYGKNVRVGRGHCQLQRYYPERYGRPGVPPRHPPLDVAPSDGPRAERLAFRGLSTAMVAARASGYVRELVAPTDTGATVDGPPALG